MDHVFWVHGTSKARFESAYLNIARILNLPGQEESTGDIVQRVHDWLSNDENNSYLMVLDNADDRELWIRPSLRNSSSQKSSRPLIELLPRGSHGRILITTRDSHLGQTLTESKHDPIKVLRLEPREARILLQSKLQEESELTTEDTDHLVSSLDYLPLTITQAAAYLREVDMTASEYIELLRAGESDIPELLEESIDDPVRDRGAPNSIFQTWKISFDQISTQNSRAADILSLMAMYDRQAIGQELLKRAEDTTLAFKAAVARLKAFSLITEEKGNESKSPKYSMHRLVQISTHRWLEEHGKLQSCQEEAVINVARFHPLLVDFKVWPILNELKSHAQKVLKYELNTSSVQIHRSNILHALGHYCLEQGQDTQAQTYLLEAKAIRVEYLGFDHEHTLTSMGFLGVSYNKLNKWKKAQDIQLQVLGITKRILGPDHRLTLKTSSRLAITYNKQSYFGDGLELQVNVLKSMKEILGPEHPDTLTEMTNLAYTYYKMKRLEEASELGQQSMQMRMRVLGKMHPDTVTSMSNLALTYEAQNRWKDAEQLYRQVVEARSITLGPDHLKTQRAKANLEHRLRGQKPRDSSRINRNRPMQLTPSTRLPENRDCKVVQRNEVSRGSSAPPTLRWSDLRELFGDLK